MINKQFFFLSIILLSFNSIKCLGIIDNRFLPLYRPMFTRTCERRNAIGSNVFFLIADKTRLEDQDKEVSLGEIFGKYDLKKIADALEFVGKPNPLKAEWQSRTDLIWDLEQKLEGQGIWFGCEKYLGRGFSVGISTYLERINSKQNFILPDKLKDELKLSKGNEFTLRQERIEADKLLGIGYQMFRDTGMSDIDIYIRYGIVREYVHKFRRIDAGLTFGILVPVDPTLNVNNPASIPLGGDGHFGIYFAGDLSLELKDDIIAGLWLQITDRFSKKQFKRFPALKEPINFGALTGEVDIKPGMTIGFSPFVDVEDIREGFGFRGSYTFVLHDQDKWCDLRNDKTIPGNLSEVQKNSSWISEYLSFTLLYNFDKAKRARKFAPIVYLGVDVPTRLFAAHKASFTNRVSLGFELDF